MTMMNDDIYDVAIIGGGVNGCGIARDAAGRGAKVILFERGDLARGTSSASTKLIHGGLRYLEHYEFRLVRESLIERERLWSIAPHIIWPMRFVLPYQKGLRPKWMLRAGLFLYDHIGGRKLLPPARSLNLTKDVAGGALNPEFTSGFEYSDCWVDDARLVVLNAMDAFENGAVISPQTEITSLECRDGIWFVYRLGHTEPVKARTVINAAGPAVLDLLNKAKGHVRNGDETIRLVRGSHIIVRKIFDHPKAYFCQNPDGRIFFAIPYEDDFTLIGTTDADHHGPLDDVQATAQEIAYLCTSAGAYFRQKLSPADVVHSYAGVRPLVDDGSGKPESASRGYHFDLDVTCGAPLLSVFGGKITTYRHLGESAVAYLKPYLPILDAPGWTASKPLPGGDFPVRGADQLGRELAREYPFVAASQVRRIVRSYGTRAQQWLGSAKTAAQLGIDFGHGLSKAEVDYCFDHEWARTAEDILWRRSKLGLVFTKSQTEQLQLYLDGKQI